LYFGKEVLAERCNTRCSGDKKQMCGGSNDASTVYALVPDLPGFHIAAPPTKNTAFFAFRSGQTCGQDPRGLATVKGATTMTGTVDVCKSVCLSGFGASECNGFTYDAGSSKCTFHTDVFAGAIRVTGKAACYWKPK